MEKELYKECANQLPKGWNKRSISDLAHDYIETENDPSGIAEAYLSAIICKVWQPMESAYYKQQYKFASIEDLYDATIDAVLYVLAKRVWLDPDNSLYNDPIGPEKAINVKIKSSRLNVFEFLGRQKRRLNNGILSLEEIQADKSEGICLPYRDADIVSLDFIYDKIMAFYNKKEYFKAFAIFAILICDVYRVDTEDEIDYNSFSLSSLRRTLHTIDDGFCVLFAQDLDLPLDDVIAASAYVKDLSAAMIDTRFNNLMRELRSDKTFINLLKGGCTFDF